MAYTVKKISQLSGVTVRTLHFYEEIELLKPAYYGSNGYRYYEEKQLLQLQQILFFKELGFSLKQIRKVLGRSDFDQLAALHSHRATLSRDWERMGRLIETIDKTIKHLNGLKKMKDKEIFDGFSLCTKGKGNESYFAAEELLLNNLKKQHPQSQEKSFRDEINKTASGIYSKISKCIENGLKPTSDEVQKLVKKHHDLTERFHIATKEVYKALAKLYIEHPEFRKQLDYFDPRLAGFMAEAMQAFADRELS